MDSYLKKYKFVPAAALAALLALCSCESDVPGKDKAISDQEAAALKIKRELPAGMRAELSKSLLLAVSKGEYETVKLLAENGADLNSRDKDGWTPLMWSVHCGQDNITVYLIKKGADLDMVDNEGSTALMLAIKNSCFDAAAMMVEKGARVGTKNRKGEDALILAVDKGQEDIVRLILEKGRY
jgi:ankyrin repeat protein